MSCHRCSRYRRLGLKQCMACEEVFGSGFVATARVGCASCQQHRHAGLSRCLDCARVFPCGRNATAAEQHQASARLLRDGGLRHPDHRPAFQNAVREATRREKIDRVLHRSLLQAELMRFTHVEMMQLSGLSMTGILGAIRRLRKSGDLIQVGMQKVYRHRGERGRDRRVFERAGTLLEQWSRLRNAAA